MKTRAITEGALMAALTVVAALLSNYVPSLAAVSYFLAPLPTTVCCKRWGMVTGTIECVAASALLLLFVSPMNALILAVDIVVPGLMIGYSYHKDMAGGSRVAIGYFAFLITLAFELAVAQMLTGVSMMEDFLNQINDSTQTVIDVYKQAGLFEGEEGATLMENMNTVVESFKMLLPTILLITPALFAYVTVLLDDMFFKRFKLSYSPVPPITQWHISQFSKTVLAVALLGSILGRYLLQDNPTLVIYPYTVEMLTMFVYTIMGFAFMCWLIEFKTKKRMIWLRVLIAVACSVFSILSVLLELVGIFDVNFDIRRFIDRREAE